MNWLTIPEAAKRVDRAERTIYAWLHLGYLQKYEVHRDGRAFSAVIEKRLLEVEREQRGRRGRPRKAEPTTSLDWVDLDVIRQTLINTMNRPDNIYTSDIQRVTLRRGIEHIDEVLTMNSRDDNAANAAFRLIR